MGEGKREDPFFLVGDSRSGTTYLANLLIHHEEIGLAPESKFVLRLLDDFGDGSPIGTQNELESTLERIYSERKFQDWQIERGALKAALTERLPLTLADMTRYIVAGYCEREFPNCRVWGLKKGGGYILAAARLLAHFPTAKFVHLVRDGRAVFNSKRKALHSGSGRPLESSAVGAAERWIEFVDAFDAFREEHPESAFEIRYESMVADPGLVLGSIFDFLSVDRDESIAERARVALDPVYVVDRSRHLHENVSKPPQLGRIGAWREELSERDVRAYETVARRGLQKKGYETVSDGADVVSLLVHRLRKSAKSLKRRIRD